jgi:hypothetical protein
MAKFTQAEPAFAAPFAQHALSPANALDAINVATATKVVVILIMVNAQTDLALQRSIFIIGK